MAESSTGSAGGLLGTLYIRLTAQTEELDTKMTASEKKVTESAGKMEKAAEGLKRGLEILGVSFGIVEIVEFVKHTIEATNELKKFSEEIGVGIDKLAGLKFAADKADIGSKFEMGMRKFSESLRQAQVEGSAMQHVFQDVLKVDPTQGIDKALDGVIARFSGWKDGVDKMGMAQELFGIRNARFVNLLNQGTDGVKKSTEELAKVTGMSFEDAARKTEEYHDATVTLHASLSGLALTFLTEALPSVTSFKTEMAEGMPVLREWATILGDAVGPTLKAIIFIIDGVKGAFQVAAIAIVGYAEMVLHAWREAGNIFLSIIQTIINGALAGINSGIALINAAIDKLPKALVPTALQGGLQPIKIDLNQSLGGVPKEILSGMHEWEDILHDAHQDLSNKLAEDYDKTKDVVKKGNDELKKASAEGFIGPQVPPNIEELKKYYTDIANFRDAALGGTGGTGMGGIGGKGGQIGKLQGEIAGLKNIPGLAEDTKNRTELEEISSHLKEIQKLRDDAARLGLAQDEKTQKAMTDMEDLYKKKRDAIQMAELQLRVGTFAKMSNDILAIGSAFAGQQTALYKSMFVVSKAFAIAESTVKIALGIAEAAGTPWPANLFAIASVVAATASIVSSIQSVQLEFGGARAEGGPVDPNHSFLVGEEGPEMFVPRSAGTIVPNPALAGGRQMPPKVVVNNYTDAQPMVTSRNENGEQIIEIMVKRVSDRIGSDLRDGKGPVNKAMGDSFGLRRGRGQ